jgi:hypothetical protein
MLPLFFSILRYLMFHVWPQCSTTVKIFESDAEENGKSVAQHADPASKLQ